MGAGVSKAPPNQSDRVVRVQTKYVVSPSHAAEQAGDEKANESGPDMSHRLCRLFDLDASFQLPMPPPRQSSLIRSTFLPRQASALFPTIVIDGKESQPQDRIWHMGGFGSEDGQRSSDQTFERFLLLYTGAGPSTTEKIFGVDTPATPSTNAMSVDSSTSPTATPLFTYQSPFGEIEVEELLELTIPDSDLKKQANEVKAIIRRAKLLDGGKHLTKANGTKHPFVRAGGGKGGGN